ncbi:MAG: 50S ribosomal protein L13 [Nitrospirales bacterium]|nr:50S ribosomal protein L13 [Nitrospira sp.]MDR4501949.1 50S ribosomal protein L13 [Nitrospirales bacterium]
MRSFQAKPLELERKWHIIDAEGKTLGRLASRIAMVLRGKHKPIFTPNVDTGDHVVVINAGRIQLTRDKFKVKTYYHHTGYPGGIKSVTAEKLHEKKPTELLNVAIRGMLPKNSLGKQMAKKLRLYPGPEHPHAAQNPQPLVL